MGTAKRVGIWIRVSTDFQVDSESPEHHEERARSYAAIKNWEVAELYRLDAVSGKSVFEHPELKRMLKDIAQGHISGLIFSKLARLARNTRELLEISELFRASDADLISLAEAIDTSSPAGRLFFTIIAAMAQWEREEIAERVAASVPIRAKMGKPLGGVASFGYKWEGKELVPDPKEGPVRKLMYELFLKLRRKKATAAELNRLGYRTRGGAKFSDTTIDRLIRDTCAKGVRRANYTKSTGDKRKWVFKDPKDWVLIPCEPLVEESLWNECNSILDAQYKKREKIGPMAVHLLSGFITCSCGNKMYIYHKGLKYTCKKCKNKIEATDIDEIYHTQLKSFLLSDTTKENFLERSDARIAEKITLLEKTKEQLAPLKKKLDEYVEMRVTKQLSPERFTAYYQPLEEQMSQLEAQIPVLEAEIAFFKISLQSADIILHEAQSLYEQWTTLPFEEKRSIVELITESIIVGKDEITLKLSHLPHTPSSETQEFSNRTMPLWFF